MDQVTNPRQILIVDDDVQLARALGRLVEAEGRVIQLAHDVASGSRLLLERPFDLLICDHDLPDGHGPDVLRVARKNQPDAPRILLTGHAEWEVAQQAVNDGEILLALQKPCDPATLRGAVDEALQLKSQRDGRRALRMIADEYARELVATNERLRRENEAQAVELTRRHLEAVAALVSAAELRRPGVRLRARAVNALTTRLGAALGLDAAQALDLQAASMLWEVGILVVGDRELGEHDRGEGDQHLRIAEAGSTILARMSNLQGAARLLQHQHDRWVGGHDPRAPSRREIPIGARILAAVTRFCELSQRGSPEAARTELMLEAGNALDPTVVTTLLEVEQGLVH